MLIFPIAYFQAAAAGSAPASDYEAAASAGAAFFCGKRPGHNTLGIMMMSSLARTSAPPGWDCILLVYFGVSMFASRTLLSIGGAKCENVFLRCTFDCCLNWSGTKSDKADDKKYCNPLKRPTTLAV